MAPPPTVITAPPPTRPPLCVNFQGKFSRMRTLSAIVLSLIASTCALRATTARRCVVGARMALTEREERVAQAMELKPVSQESARSTGLALQLDDGTRKSHSVAENTAFVTGELAFERVPFRHYDGVVAPRRPRPSLCLDRPWMQALPGWLRVLTAPIRLLPWDCHQSILCAARHCAVLCV